MGDVQPLSITTSSILTVITPCPQILMRGLHHLIIVLQLLFDGSIVFLSGGVPYMYYRLIHPKRFPDDVELGNMDIPCPQDTSDVNLKEHWADKLPHVYNVWKAHRLIVGMVLAPMFPLISISPLPKCSWAYIFAILCLIYGSITFAVCIIHRLYFHTFIKESHLYKSPCCGPDNGFFDRNIMHFYVSLSLPTVWFMGFLGSFALTILMVMIGEQDPPFELGLSVSQMACQGNRLNFLRVVVPFMLVVVTINYVRMKWGLKSFTSVQVDT